jgi:hypothetical protein
VTVLKRCRLECPACGATVDGAVTHADGHPWPSYVAECGCGYVILESEWNEVAHG